MSESDTSQSRLSELKQCKTLSEFIPLRARQIPTCTALRQFDRSTNTWVDVTYADLAERIEHWRKALTAMKLQRGARVAILLNNSVDAVLADQAVMANGLIPVPLHAIDTPGASAFIIIDSQASCLITNKLARWRAIEATGVPMPDLHEVIFTDEITPTNINGAPQLIGVDDWLEQGQVITELPTGPSQRISPPLCTHQGQPAGPKE